MKHNQHLQYMRLTLCATAISSLMACGGGGSDSAQTAPAPVPAPAPAPNQAPTIGNLLAQEVAERTSMIIDADATDADGSIASYQWSQLSGPAVELGISDTQSLSFEAPTVEQNEEIVLQLTVTDNEGSSTTESLQITALNTHFETDIRGKISLDGEHQGDVSVRFQYGSIQLSSRTDAQGDYHFEAELPLPIQQLPYRLEADTEHAVLSKVDFIESLLNERDIARSPLAFSQNVSDIDSELKGEIKSEKQTSSIEINELTTSESALLSALYEQPSQILSEAFIDSDEFSSLFDHVSTAKFIELSAFMTYMQQNDIPAPTPFTFENLALLIEETQAATENFDTAMSDISASLASAQANRENFDDIASAQFPLTVFPILASAKNTVRLGIIFDFVYRFESEDQVLVIDNDGGEVMASWEILDNGKLRVSRDDAQGWYQWSYNTAEHGVCSEKATSKDWSMIRKRGNAPDAALIDVNYRVECEDGYTDDFSSPQYVSLVTEDNSKSFRVNEFNDKLLAIELPGEEARGDNFVANVLRFDSDMSGVNQDSGENFTWSIDNGVTSISFAGGESVNVHKVQENKQGAYGIVQIYTDQSGALYSNKGMMVEVTTDQGFVNEDDYYGVWRSGFDVSQANQHRKMGFSIVLSANGNSERISSNFYDNEIHTSTSPMIWDIETGQLVNYRSILEGQFERCLPSEDTECWNLNVRKWDLLAQHGNRIYVRESLHYNFSRPENNQELAPLSDSRLNFYQID